MNVDVKAADGGMSLPSSHRTTNPSKPSWLIRIWLGVLVSLQESREREAMRLIRRHRHLIQDEHAIEVPVHEDHGGAQPAAIGR